MKKQIKPSQVAALRLSRHHLAQPGQPDLATICQDVCGIQAQVMSIAYMALWARKHDLRPAEIQAALKQNSPLIKTSCMRRTLFLIAAADLPVYINALKRSRMAALQRNMAKCGVAPKEVERLNTIIVRTLSNGPLTQGELTEIVKPKVTPEMRDWMGKTWIGSVFRPALSTGLICYGPNRGPEVTYVRVDQWLPSYSDVAEDDAKRILLRRYLKAYGPGTIQDFVHWSGISMVEARPVWNSITDELLEVTVDGEKAYIIESDYEHLMNQTPKGQSLRLLPGFDPYMLGHAGKDHMVDPSVYKRVYRNQGWITPVVLLNGKAMGVWTPVRRGSRLTVTIEPFEQFSRQIRALIEAEVASLAEFLSSSYELNYSS